MNRQQLEKCAFKLENNEISYAKIWVPLEKNFIVTAIHICSL